MWGIVLLVALGFFAVWVLKNDTLRWIFALIGLLVFLGWIFSHCGRGRASVSAPKPDRVVVGLVESGLPDLQVPLEEP